MRRYLWLLVAMTYWVWGVDAKLTIEKDVEQRTRIAVVDASSQTTTNVHRLFVSDLKLSGHFLPRSDYEQGKLDRTVLPSQKSVEYLLKYTYDTSSGAALHVKLVRTADAKELFDKRYAVKHTDKMPFLVHKAVYDINGLLRYPDIGWINRYILYARYVAPRRTIIGVADYTFTYRKSIIRGGLNLFPKWADSRQHAFYYTSLNGSVPTLYKLNIYTGSRSKVASSQGMLVCSDVSRDGSRILLTMAPEGQPDIYEMRVGSGAKRRLTTFSGIDVGAHYAGNDDRIVFVSNRLGYANLFQKRIGDSAVSQAIYHGRKNNACDAHGDTLVYASRESNAAFSDNRFNLYLTSLGSGSTRPLTTTGSNQSPHLSPDGHVVLYLKQTRSESYVGYINLESRRSLLFPLGYRLQSIDW